MSDVHVLGDGCAAMMLASRADELNGHTLSIVRPEGAPRSETTCLASGPRLAWNSLPSKLVMLGQIGPL